MPKVSKKEVGKKFTGGRKITVVGAGGFLSSVTINHGETRADALERFRDEQK